LEIFLNIDMIMIIGSLVIAASIAGFLAGLLGIGGGIIIVPCLFTIFTYLQYPDEKMMHVAVATALATTIFTTCSSVYAHYKRKAINIDFFIMFVPAIIVGVIMGTISAEYISSDGLLGFFGFMLGFFAVMMFFDPSKISDKIPNIPKFLHMIIGTIIGYICSLLGIGGATLNVPYMVLNKICIRNAVATASAFALSVAVAGTSGFLYAGIGEETNIPNTFGYIHYLSFIIMIPITMLMAPLGAKVAHIVNVNILRKAFAVVMLIVSLKMLYSAFS